MKPKTILIGFTQYSTIEFENDGFRLLFNRDYCNKFRSYIWEWGVDEEAVFCELVNNCCDLIKGDHQMAKRNDLPIRLIGNYGMTTNLLNGIKIQFLEDTLFGKCYESKIHTLKVEKENIVHLLY